MTTKIKKVLPAGIAVWPKLDQVDVFTPKKGAPKRRYTINVKFEDEDHRKVDAWLKKIAADAGVSTENMPWKTDKKNKDITLFAFSGEKYKPPVFDAKNNKLPETVIVGGGSKVRISVTVNPFDGFGGGVSLYLNAVQVLELKQSEYGKSDFEEAEGFSYTGPAEGEKEGAEFDPSSTEDDDDF